MERKKPVSGEFYRHFKGKTYQVKMLALDSETQREQVVYQAMYEPFLYWVRDLEEFMGMVDTKKHPESGEKYRFEKITFAEAQKEGNFAIRGEDPETQAEGGSKVEISDREFLKAVKTGQPERYLGGKLTDSEIAHRGLLQLLDADTFHERRQILIGLKQYIDKRMLNNIAVAFDIVLEEGDIEEQYDSIMRCIEAFERYEGGRLR